MHGFCVESETARYLILTTPRHGQFYGAITLPSRPGGLPPLESIDGQRIHEAAQEYGIENSWDGCRTAPTGGGTLPQRR